MITKTLKNWIVAASIILAIGMFIPTPPTLANTNSLITVKPPLITLNGTIHKLAVEGTCYQLTTNEGKNYELMGKFPKRDGVKVRVSGVVATDVATICQVGQPFKVRSVRVLK
jgi:hypothetical protein